MISIGDGRNLSVRKPANRGRRIAIRVMRAKVRSVSCEIGHTGDYTTPAAQFCLPGSATKPPCYSYDVPTWLKFQPL
jgi:hypothetical protein